MDRLGAYGGGRQPELAQGLGEVGRRELFPAREAVSDAATGSATATDVPWEVLRQLDGVDVDRESLACEELGDLAQRCVLVLPQALRGETELRTRVA